MTVREALLRLTFVIVVDLVALAFVVVSFLLLFRGYFVAPWLFLAGAWLLQSWAEREFKRIPEPPR